jgi:hypothetical protein
MEADAPARYVSKFDYRKATETARAQQRCILRSTARGNKDAVDSQTLPVVSLWIPHVSGLQVLCIEVLTEDLGM